VEILGAGCPGRRKAPVLFFIIRGKGGESTLRVHSNKSGSLFLLLFFVKLKNFRRKD
jgi:hypothetical protein